MSYLAFLRGLPILTSFRIFTAFLSYTASLLMGFIPAVSILFLTASTLIFSSFAISDTVMPSTFIISEHITEKLDNLGYTVSRNRHFSRMCNKVSNIFDNYIDKVSNVLDTYCISETTPLHRAGRAPIGANAVQDRGSNRRFFIQEEAC